MSKFERLENLKSEMDRLKLDMMGSSEVKWGDVHSIFTIRRMYNNNTKLVNEVIGVGIVTNKRIG